MMNERKMTIKDGNHELSFEIEEDTRGEIRKVKVEIDNGYEIHFGTNGYVSVINRNGETLLYAEFKVK